jgi:phosphoketolase
MKSFVEYLNESKKTYQFKIGFAGELPEMINDKLETALQKFGLLKMSSGKKTPIQERPLDFPQLQNTEVTYYEAEVSYPTTPQVLESYLGDVCSVKKSNIIVRNPNEPLETMQAEKAKDSYEVLLTKEDMGGESAQGSVGSNRVMELLKELESTRKDRDNNYVGDAPVGKSKDISDAKNIKSVLGA